MAKVPLWGARQQGMQNPGSFPWCRLDLIAVGFQALLVYGMDRITGGYLWVKGRKAARNSVGRKKPVDVPG